MVDIKWAQDNCKVNTAKLRKIEEDAIKLESMLDENIKTACDNGKHAAIINKLYGTYDESIEKVCNKYSNAGYKVTFKDDSREFNYILVEW